MFWVLFPYQNQVRCPLTRGHICHTQQGEKDPHFLILIFSLLSKGDCSGQQKCRACFHPPLLWAGWTDALLESLTYRWTVGSYPTFFGTCHIVPLE